MVKRPALLVFSFLLAILITFVFAFRAGRNVRAARSPNEPIRPWMSIPFVAHVHHVPVQSLFDAIGVEPHQPRDRRPIRRIAREEKIPVDELIRDLNQAIARQRQANPPPPGQGP